MKYKKMTLTTAILELIMQCNLQKKKFLFIMTFFALMICTGFVTGSETVYAANVVDSGTCGDNLTWTFTDDGVLTVSGEGEMNYESKGLSYLYIAEDEARFYTVTPWFDYSASIEQIVIEDGVTSIQDGTFRGYNNLTNVSIANSVVTIGEYAFEDCTELINVELPESVTTIGMFAFINCTSLGSIDILGSNIYIGRQAFTNCTNLVEINISDSISGIGMYAFENTGYYNNENNWKSCVLYIGNVLVDADESIRDSYVVKDGTTCIADYAFEYCYDLTEIIIPDSVVYLGLGAFYDCSGITNIVLGDGITEIGSWFHDMTSLKSVTLGNSVTEISEKAFKGCKRLSEIVIPASVVSIGDSAFYDCTSLSEIYFRGDAPEIGTSAFYNVKATGYYPEDGSWSESDFVDHGGSITWAAYDASIYIEEETSDNDNISAGTDENDDVSGAGESAGNNDDVDNTNGQINTNENEETGFLTRIINFIRKLFAS